MTYAIRQPGVGVKDRACVDECPIDCIHEGTRALHIHPDECVAWGACVPVCAVERIYCEDDLPDQSNVDLIDGVVFFQEALPGQSEPLGSPGGATKLGVIDATAPFVASQPEGVAP